jgi:hypothetical protein
VCVLGTVVCANYSPLPALHSYLNHQVFMRRPGARAPLRPSGSHLSVALGALVALARRCAQRRPTAATFQMPSALSSALPSPLPMPLLPDGFSGIGLLSSQSRSALLSTSLPLSAAFRLSG